MKINEIYDNSKELKALLLKFGWELYDFTDQPKDRPFTWDEIDLMNPADEYLIGNQYFLIPIKEYTEQSLREVYSRAKGLGPCMKIEDENYEGWLALELHNIFSLICFTRIIFAKEGIVLTTPKSSLLPKPDMVCLRYREAMQTFREKFFIVTAEEVNVAYNATQMVKSFNSPISDE